MSRSEGISIRTEGLGKRYGTTWALQDCDLRVPRGRVSALVGPNGAGKTTLLRLLVGLSQPSAGRATVLGKTPKQDSDFLPLVGYLAQDVPLYKQLTAADHLAIGARLNPIWTLEDSRRRLLELRVPLDRPVKTLSGGQRAQVGLALTLAKCPELLLLDEPVAALDPLARRQFLAALSEAVAQSDVSVVLSSHLLHDLERVSDHVILLSASRVQLCNDIDDLLAQHRLLIGPRRRLSQLEPGINVIKATQTENQTRLLARIDEPLLDPTWIVEEVGLEEIILGYMSDEAQGTEHPFALAGTGR